MPQKTNENCSISIQQKFISPGLMQVAGDFPPSNDLGFRFHPFVTSPSQHIACEIIRAEEKDGEKH